mmetsp:Transcript_6077/g.15074  ORF Transcript_6077/g.15074 Transcript_6077/m.15074 type:complete len:220 (+) Transcript_6077:694-1353(+)
MGQASTHCSTCVRPATAARCLQQHLLRHSGPTQAQAQGPCHDTRAQLAGDQAAVAAAIQARARLVRQLPAVQFTTWHRRAQAQPQALRARTAQGARPSQGGRPCHPCPRHGPRRHAPVPHHHARRGRRAPARQPPRGRRHGQRPPAATSQSPPPWQQALQPPLRPLTQACRTSLRARARPCASTRPRLRATRRARASRRARRPAPAACSAPRRPAAPAA